VHVASARWAFHETVPREHVAVLEQCSRPGLATCFTIGIADLTEEAAPGPPSILTSKKVLESAGAQCGKPVAKIRRRPTTRSAPPGETQHGAAQVGQMTQIQRADLARRRLHPDDQRAGWRHQPMLHA
jgi:hypothetical protein